MLNLLNDTLFITIIPDSCIKGNTEIGTLLHYMWYRVCFWRGALQQQQQKQFAVQ